MPDSGRAENGIPESFFEPIEYMVITPLHYPILFYHNFSVFLRKCLYIPVIRRSKPIVSSLNVLDSEEA